MENKQTAVEWLENSLAKTLKRIVENRDGVLLETLFEQAKQMEKEQIINAFIDGEHQQGFELEAEQYYNKTYNK
jgi:hypothetical protein